LNSDSARRSLRAQLLQQRAALIDRPAREQALQQRVARWLTQAEVRAVAFYWPVRGEPDLRPVLAEWLGADASRVAGLPVINGDALEFHHWTFEAPMQAGEYGIPVPAHGRVVQPDCLFVPCVGFDARRHRLGYGSGYYDRTLASLVPWPLAVGIAFEVARVDSIEPQQHDMRLDVVLTDAGEY
jgi:5-formyltetrahydrofolate cyclo-ligase